MFRTTGSYTVYHVLTYAQSLTSSRYTTVISSHTINYMRTRDIAASRPNGPNILPNGPKNESKIDIDALQEEITRLVKSVKNDLSLLLYINEDFFDADEQEYLYQFGRPEKLNIITQKDKLQNVDHLIDNLQTNLNLLLEHLSRLLRSHEITEQAKIYLEQHLQMILAISAKINKINTATTNQDKPKSTDSRRTFLKMVFAAGAMVPFAGSWLGKELRLDFNYQTANGLLEPDQQNYEMKIYLTYLQKIYDITVYAGLPLVIDELTASLRIRGEEPNAAEMTAALRALYIAVNYYPFDFFRRIGRHKIRLVKNLQGRSYDNLSWIPISGYNSVELIPNIAKKSIYLDVGAKVGEYALIETFHHETAHDVLPVGIPSEEWFGYLENELECIPYNNLHPKSSNCSNDLYITDFGDSSYSRTNYWEDFAKFAAAMFDGPLHSLLLSKIKRLRPEFPRIANMLQKKYEFVKRIYKEKSGGKIDDAFWQDLINGEVDDQYWAQRQ